jgi:hypothetical protein
VLDDDFFIHHTFEGFDYDFCAIRDESNELFNAYKEMFEVVISQGALYRTLLIIYAPLFNRLFVRAYVMTRNRHVLIFNTAR